MDLLSWAKLQWDRLGAWACVAAGAIALIVGWVGMSSTAYPAEQLPYMLSGGLGGMFLLGLGAMLWLSADLRDEWRKLDLIQDELRGAGNGGAANSQEMHSADDLLTGAPIEEHEVLGPSPRSNPRASAAASGAVEDTKEIVAVGRGRRPAISDSATLDGAPPATVRTRKVASAAAPRARRTGARQA